MITLSLNIGSLIGILGIATFICDIVALYVHGQSNVHRQQKFQDVDLNLVRLERLNSLPATTLSEATRKKLVEISNENHQNKTNSAYEEFAPTIVKLKSEEKSPKMSPTTSMKQRRPASISTTPETPVMNTKFNDEEPKIETFL